MTSSPTQPNPDAVRLICKAVRFAAERHTDQRRKGARAEPYFNHLAEVAEFLSEATNGSDAQLVAAGFLHDTVEDTDTPPDEITKLFGSDVATLVACVTDDKSQPKAVRKQLQIEKAPGLPNRAKLLKIADKTSNLRSMVASPPDGWSTERIANYIDWAEQVVSGCRGLAPTLEAQFDAAVRAARRRYT